MLLFAEPETLVRFESAEGDGVFGACSYFLDLVETRAIRVSKQIVVEVTNLNHWLRARTESPPVDAYRDQRNRRPITWYKLVASEHVQRARLVCRLLNREGMDVREALNSDRLRILWQDDVQVITRVPRRPKPASTGFLKQRRATRVQKQKRRRVRRGRAEVRRKKSGI